jgi:RNA recognition motif-containing protein
MKDESSEDKAITELDGAEWLVRELKVNKAKPRESRSPSGGDRGSYGPLGSYRSFSIDPSSTAGTIDSLLLSSVA